MSAEIVGFPDRRLLPSPEIAPPRRTSVARSIAEMVGYWRDWVASLEGPEEEGYTRDGWVDEHSEALMDLEREIAATPGTSMSDILIKLRLQATTNDVISDGEVIADADAYSNDGNLETHLLLSALRDVERLAGSAGAT